MKNSQKSLQQTPIRTIQWRSTLRGLSASGWTLAVIALALPIAIPAIGVLSSIFFEAKDTWQHLTDTVLTRYIVNSLLLTIGVGFGVVVIGVGCAWLVTMCRFRASRVFEWALLLPLAAPAYVLAYTYGDYWFPNVRSLPGAILMLILVLYPYVYLLTRVAFLEQSTCTLEASRILGCSPWRSFITVALPMARPAIVAGLALALMETLNDYGTVQYFGVDTFTTGIYRTWFGMGERIAANQLAAMLLLFVLGLILLERWSRSRTKYYQASSRYRQIQTYQLKGIREILAVMACFLPLFLGFLLPAGLLVKLTLANWQLTLDERFWIFARHSLILATLTAILAVVIALIMAYGLRLYPSLGVQLATRVAAMGYAVPGSVIAVGIMVPIGKFDNLFDSWMRENLGISTGLLLSGTIAALVFAYIVRFLAVSLNAVESSLSKIKPNLDDAARSLGYSPMQTLVTVHTPMMTGGLLTAMMLVFVDVMKELPDTIIIRPFNFDTLAVRTYQLASDERLAEASGPALAIVLVGMLPVILLSWKIARSRKSSTELTVNS